jgi:hypothetical protein
VRAARDTIPAKLVQRLLLTVKRKAGSEKLEAGAAS